MRRSLAAILAVPTLINGLAMLVAGPFWYHNVPGVTATGPFNPHFVQDIGVAFLVAGLALAARAWQPQYWPAAVAGAAFLVAHALIHPVAIIRGHDHQAMFDLLLIVLPAALALFSAFPAQENVMRSWISRRMLRAAAERYGYDGSSLDMMLTESPTAFFKFARLTKAANHREVVPVEASFAAKIMGALAEDCGACTQLCVNMALEAGMARDQIEAVLRHDPHAMSDATCLAFRFAAAVVRRSADCDEFRDAVRAQWGQKGVIDLTMALQMSRIFPMIETALGYGRECRRFTVDGHNVEIIKQAA